MKYRFGREVTVKLPEPTAQIAGESAVWTVDQRSSSGTQKVSVMGWQKSGRMLLHIQPQGGDEFVYEMDYKAAKTLLSAGLAAADYAEGGENAPV